MTPPRETAASSAHGIILMVAVTIVLAVLVLLMALALPNLVYDPTVPDIFVISNVRLTYHSPTGLYDNYVTITNTVAKDYRNRYIKVNTYVNNRLTGCDIPTLNNNLFISQAHHFGVKRLHGMGTLGNPASPLSVWPGNSAIAIEYSRGTLRPGDTLTLEFIDTITGQVISRDTWPHNANSAEKWMRMYFNRQGA